MDEKFDNYIAEDGTCWISKEEYYKFLKENNLPLPKESSEVSAIDLKGDELGYVDEDGIQWVSKEAHDECLNSDSKTI